MSCFPSSSSSSSAAEYFMEIYFVCTLNAKLNRRHGSMTTTSSATTKRKWCVCNSVQCKCQPEQRQQMEIQKKNDTNPRHAFDGGDDMSTEYARKRCVHLCLQCALWRTLSARLPSTIRCARLANIFHFATQFFLNFLPSFSSSQRIVVSRLVVMSGTSRF